MNIMVLYCVLHVSVLVTIDCVCSVVWWISFSSSLFLFSLSYEFMSWHSIKLICTKATVNMQSSWRNRSSCWGGAYSTSEGHRDRRTDCHYKCCSSSLVLGPNFIFIDRPQWFLTLMALLPLPQNKTGTLQTDWRLSCSLQALWCLFMCTGMPTA